MTDPAAILCKELSRSGVNINPDLMRRALQTAGLTLTGGATQAARNHLETVEKLSRDAFSV